MNTKVVLIVLGEPNSTFSEILFKYFKTKNFNKTKNKIVLIGNNKLLLKQMKRLNYKLKLNKIDDIKSLKKINIINIDYK